jgi:hypothetical protein
VLNGPGRRTLGGVVLLDVVVQRHRRRTDRQPLATGAHRLLQLVEQDLEAAETLVEEVLRLVAEAAGIGLGRLHDLPSPLLGGPHDLGALHHPFGLDA